jgi:adenylylsulfate reductase, subunit B
MKEFGKIDDVMCNGCGLCVSRCPLDVFRIDEKSKKAVFMYPEDCTYCGACQVECPGNAITIIPEKGTPPILAWE